MQSRTTVLLGAGASVDAGLPLTVRLAEKLVERANQSPSGRQRADWVSALNFVYGAMVGYQAEDGGNPLQAVNIERLISALRLLQTSSQHEVAPFVSAWKPGALGVGTPSQDWSEGRAIADAVAKAVTGPSGAAAGQLQMAIARIAITATSEGNPQAFRAAEDNILKGLSELLSDLKSVDYLSPLADLARRQPGGLDVITLNYDLAVEQMASETGTDIERGLLTWNPSTPLSFSAKDGQINLLKLHGSLDWVERHPAEGMSAPRIEVESVESEDESKSSWSPASRPWIVVGDREKLATDGPTLALIRAAEDVLHASTHLVVVGYSFSDAHINSIIRNWMLGDSCRTIGIVDTNWTSTDLDEFRKALVQAYGAAQAYASTPGRESRVLPLVGRARDRLDDALILMPIETPDPYVSVEGVTDEGDTVRISVRLHGPDLHRTSVHVTTPQSSSSYSFGVDTFVTAAEVEGPRRSTSSWRVASLDHWVTGSTIEVFSHGPASEVLQLSIYGHRLDGSGATDLLVNIE